MTKQIGLWIDHREAIVVILSGETKEVKRIKSNDEKHVRYAGGSHSKNFKQITAEDQMDRKFANHLNNFYDQVASVIHDADTIQIFGPGEAKGELVKRLEHEGLKGSILAVETSDKLTDHQIVAKVRERFESR